MSTTTLHPSNSVPTNAGTAGSGQPELSVEALTTATEPGVVSMPQMSPPAEQTVTAADDGITAWHSSKKVTAMWANSDNRNAYANVQDLGWKRINNANDSSFVTLVALLSHAEQTGSNVNVRIESDSKIHEAYVF